MNESKMRWAKCYDPLLKFSAFCLIYSLQCGFTLLVLLNFGKEFTIVACSVRKRDGTRIWCQSNTQMSLPLRTFLQIQPKILSLCEFCSFVLAQFGPLVKSCQPIENDISNRSNIAEVGQARPAEVTSCSSYPRANYFVWSVLNGMLY